MNQKKVFWRLLLLVTLFTQHASAVETRNAEVDRLIREGVEPDGVVFEMIAWDNRTWTWAAPMLAELRGQLRAKFPGLDVVVVSHGGEQFQLTHDRRDEQPEAIQQLASLSEEGMSVHVCGVHSQWNDVPAEAYLDFVDVSASGPAQINDYIKLGYRHIRLEAPD